MIWEILSAIFALSGLIIFAASIYKSQRNEFYSDTPWLLPFGVYVWGDGLVLGPFWLLVGGLSLVADVRLAQVYLFFVLCRSLYEVMYWLNHQAVKSVYEPPLFRGVKWIDGQQAAILYQLIHMSVVIGALYLIFHQI